MGGREEIERKREKDGERESIEYPRRLIEQTNRHCCFDYNPVLLSTSFLIPLFFLFSLLSLFHSFFFLFSFPYLRDRRFTGNADGNWKGIEVGRRRSGPYLDHDHVVPAWLLRRGTLHRVSGHGGAAGDGGGAHRHSERVHQGAGGTSRHSEKVSALFYITNHDFYDRARNRIRAGSEPAFLNLLRAPIQLTSVTKW